MSIFLNNKLAVRLSISLQGKRCGCLCYHKLSDRTIGFGSHRRCYCNSSKGLQSVVRALYNMDIVEKFCSIVCRKTGKNFSVFHRAVETEKIRYASLVQLSPKTTVSKAIYCPRTTRWVGLICFPPHRKHSTSITKADCLLTFNLNVWRFSVE